MNKDRNNDIQILGIINNVIKDYCRASLSLSYTIEQLERLSRTLNSPNQEWKNTFFNQIMTLEEILAIQSDRLERGESQFLPEASDYVNGALTEIERLVNDALNDLMKDNASEQEFRV